MAEMNLNIGGAAQDKECMMQDNFLERMVNFSCLASTVHTYLWRNKVDVKWPYYLQNLDKCMRVVLVPKHDCLLVRKSARCIPAPA